MSIGTSRISAQVERIGNLLEKLLPCAQNGKLDQILAQGVKIMAAIDDLQAESAAIKTSVGGLQTSVTALQTDVTAVLADIAALIAAGNNDAAIEAAVADLKTSGAALDQSNTDVTNAGASLAAVLPPKAG